MYRCLFFCGMFSLVGPLTAGEIVFPVAKDAAIQTLHQAQEKIRAFRTAHPNATDDVVIEIAGGDYELEQPLALTAADSGTEQSRTIWRAKAGETVRILGGKKLDDWKKVSDPKILEQWESGVREKIYQTNPKTAGVRDFGPVGIGGAELFFDGKPMQMARYPNEGFIKITGLLNIEPVEIHGNKGDKIGKFHYDDSRVNRWTDEKEGWVHGYWFWDWSEQRHKIQSIDTDKKLLEVCPPYHYYGYRLGQWFYGFNLLCEIDQSGEYYLDRENGVLYFYPPASPAEKESFLSHLDSLFLFDNASHITIRNLILEGCRKDAVIIQEGNNVLITASTIRNIGGTAVRVSGGFKHGVQGCDIYDAGAGGVSLTGGNRETLVPAGHFADNNHIHHFSRLQRIYQPGVTLNGVGNRATHNLIAHAPHMAIGFSGNDHLMEFNEIDDVCYESNDAGAIYAGRNWTMRGNMIRYNYFHDIEGFEKKGCVGVYLDDMFASADIIGNIFLRVTRAAMIGGGRGNSIVNNIFIDCVPSIHVDARALGWCAYHADEWIEEAAEKGTISGILWNKPPYSEKYPPLVGILEDEPKAPKGNVISRNICLRGVWDKPAGFWNTAIEAQARPYLTMENNTVWVKEKDQLVGTDPLFVDAEHPEKADFRLQPNSPALQAGFNLIPFEKIGLYKDAQRASLPMKP